MHRLGAIRNGETTRALAERLQTLRNTILADARQVLSLRIQQRIYDGFHSPKFTASLERFRKAISTSAKRFDRLEELKNSPQFDVDVLTEVFPCWIMRPEDACRMFPLRRDIFDVVIFDEASQCNPDQTLPVFARAEHAVVFGDDNQLSNEDLKRSLAGDANKALRLQSNLTELDPEGLFDQTENSLLGLTSTRDQAPIVLSEHFRCRPELVAFSNARFYADGLRVMRDGEDDKGLGPAILIHELDNVPAIGKNKVNPYEAEYLVDELVQLLDDERYKGMTLGVLSLFREQIEHIERLVEQRVRKSVREQRRLICSTVDGFQGDERDVILYSWRYSPTQSPSILSFTNGRTGDQRVNVALTRARHQAIHFISAPVDRFPPSGNAGQFMRHALEPARLVQMIEGRAHREPITEARRRAAAALAAAGLRVVEQFVACGVGVDIVVHDPESWARAAIFVDGELDRAPPPTADRRVDAQGLLERAGWTVERILAEEALAHPEGMIERVRGALIRCGPRDRPAFEGERHLTHTLTSDEEVVQVEHPAPAAGIAAEDLADYHWPAPSVESRLGAGEDVFQSDFERELYDRLAQDGSMQVVPQWRSRGKFIDLVVTDRAGRRLAIEADGEQHHQTIDGSLIPEDIYRQELLEEVGWVFHRIRLTDFHRDPDAQVEAIRRRLLKQPTNEVLATQMWGAPDISLTELEDTIAPIEAEPEPSAEGGMATSVTTSEPVSEVGMTPESGQEQDGAAGAPKPPIEPPSPREATTASAAEGAAGGERPIRPAEKGDGTPLDPEAYQGTQFDQVPLRLLTHQIGVLVRERGRLSDFSLTETYSVRFGVTVPKARRGLLKSFAWSAAGRKLVVKTDDAWLPGDQDPHPIEEVGTWTIDEIKQLARDLLDGGVSEDKLFEQAIKIVWKSDRRVSRPVAKAVGTAIREVLRTRR